MSDGRPSSAPGVLANAGLEATGQRHPRVPRSRNPAGSHELLVIQRASALIEELGTALDAELRSQPDEAERLRLLREATNRITRAANDAIQAYGKGQRAIDAEMGRGAAHAAQAKAVGDKLRRARLELLRVIETANRRYPWAASRRTEPRVGRGKHDRI